jgi:branched-chain amino acid transport system substrate-binding protein
MKAVVVLGALALVSACGNDSDGGGGGGEESPQGQVTLHLLAEVAGESAVAVNSYNNAYEMAIEDLNADGGLLGNDVVGERTPAPLDPQGSVTAYLKAAQSKPTAILGFPANFQAAAAATQIDQTGIPFISTANLEPTIARDGEAGSEWLYQLRAADNVVSAKQDARYLVEELGVSKVGIMYIDVPASPARVEGIKEEVESLGGEVVEERKHSLTATDLTGDVLAMKEAGAEGLVILSFPNQLALAFKQMAQNDVTIPVTATTSLETFIVNGIGTVPEGQKAFGVLDCNVPEKSPDWAARYQEKYDEPASDVAAGTYDSVMFIAAAVEKAGSTEPDAVREAMDELQYDDGVCSDDMHVDEQGVIQHGTVMVDYSVDPAVVVATYDD